MKDKEIKLQEIQKHNPQLYQDVMDGKVKLQDAYNLARSKNLPTLDKEIETIMKSHKPSLESLLDSIKKQFVFTWDKSIKDYLEK